MEVSKEPIFDVSNFKTAAKFIDAVLSQKYKFIVFGGAIRGGKSFSGVGALTLLHKIFPKSRSCIVRKDLEVLRRNMLPTCEKVIPDQMVKNFNASEYKWTFNNGSEMFFFAEGYERDKEYKRWNGLEINFILMDQVEEMQPMIMRKAIERAGAYFVPQGYNQPKPIILITTNPTQTWIKKLVYDKWVKNELPENWLYIPSKITDNPHLEESYIESLQEMKKIDPIHYQRFVDGDWDVQDNIEGGFYKDFSFSKSVGCAMDDMSVYYDEDLALHITFDFNVNPYMTLIVSQLEIQDENDINYKSLKIIDEFCLATPMNTTKAVCNTFAKKYRMHLGGLFVYGDPSGNQEDTRSEKGHNDYKIIKQELKSFHPRFKVAKSAPSVVMRGNFINTIFRNQRLKDGSYSSNYKGIEISIDKDCINVIKDYTNLLEDADGKKLKSKKTDHVTKVRFEEYGHCSDALDYMICEIFKKQYTRYQLGEFEAGKHHIPQSRSKKF